MKYALAVALVLLAVQSAPADTTRFHCVIQKDDGRNVVPKITIESKRIVIEVPRGSFEAWHGEIRYTCIAY
jgi:hypothetical protein